MSSEVFAFATGALAPPTPPRPGLSGHERASAGKDEWLTPPVIIQDLGPFDLDPCAPVNRPWPTAKEHFTIVEDGLRQAWRGRVWLNPPYGPETGKWLHRLAEHGDGVALVFARTETNAWHEWVWPLASGVLFLKGRLAFYHVDGHRSQTNAGAPSALIGNGHANAERLRRSALAGHYVPLGVVAA